MATAITTEIHCSFDEMVDLVALVPHPRNPNTHPDRQIQLLAKIIEHQGWRVPITVSKRSGFIIRGHGRLLAAQKLDLGQAPVDYQDYANEAEEWADLIADNRIAELAQINEDELGKLMAELSEAGDLDMELTGFDGKDLEQMLAAAAPADVHEDDFDLDEEAAKITEAVTQPGDIWHLGDHRLVCGDGTDPLVVAELMDGQKAAMVFTDPPYNVEYGKSKNHPNWKIRSIEGDSQTPEAWQEFCARLAEVLKEYSAGDVYVWGASGPDGMRQRLALIDAGAHWSATIIWKKNQLVLSPAKYQRIYEPCFYGWFGKSSFRGGRKQVEVWEFDRPRSSELHPTMKPIALCANAISNSSQAGEIVMDLFLGSGSTLMAAEQLGRKCFGVEVDPRYCDVIVKRWEQLTGRSAHHAVQSQK